MLENIVLSLKPEVMEALENKIQILTSEDEDPNVMRIFMVPESAKRITIKLRIWESWLSDCQG